MKPYWLVVWYIWAWPALLFADPAKPQACTELEVVQVVGASHPANATTPHIISGEVRFPKVWTPVDPLGHVVNGIPKQYIFTASHDPYHFHSYSIPEEWLTVDRNVFEQKVDQALAKKQIKVKYKNPISLLPAQHYTNFEFAIDANQSPLQRLTNAQPKILEKLQSQGYTLNSGLLIEPQSLGHGLTSEAYKVSITVSKDGKTMVKKFAAVIRRTKDKEGKPLNSIVMGQWMKIDLAGMQLMSQIKVTRGVAQDPLFKVIHPEIFLGEEMMWLEELVETQYGEKALSGNELGELLAEYENASTNELRKNEILVTFKKYGYGSAQELKDDLLDLSVTLHKINFPLIKFKRLNGIDTYGYTGKENYLIENYFKPAKKNKGTLSQDPMPVKAPLGIDINAGSNFLRGYNPETGKYQWYLIDGA